MDIFVNVHVHLGELGGTSLDDILAAIQQLGTTTMKELDDLTAEVAATEGEEQSAIVLIEGIAAQLQAAGTDPTKLQALTNGLKTQGAALAAAMASSEGPLSITPTTFTGTAGSAITGTLSATGGSAPYTFQTTGAAPGVSIDVSGNVSGSFPTPAGTVQASVTATDSVGKVSSPAVLTFTGT